MTLSKKLLAVILSCLILLDSPAISITAAEPDIPSDGPSISSESDDIQSEENKTTNSSLVFYYLKTIPDTFSAEGTLFQEAAALSKEVPASVIAGETFYLTLLAPGGQSLEMLGLNPQQLTLSADNASVLPVFAKGYSGFLAAVTPQKEGALHLEVCSTSDQNQTSLAQLNFTVAPPADADTDINKPSGKEDDTLSDTDTLNPETVVTEDFRLNYSQYTLHIGENCRLYPAASPAAAVNVNWSSSLPAIASVDYDGNVTALKKGTAVIKASMPVTEHGTTIIYEALCTVTVNNTMEFSKNSYTLNAGKTQLLNLITNPADAVVEYQSSDASIASVSPSGLVRAVSGGKTGTATAVITASWEDLTASCTITVNNTVTLDKKSYTVYTGTKQSYSLKATPAPAGTVIWKSSDTRIATVSAAGKITPKKNGKATITASAGGVTASCSLTVKKPSLSLASKKTIYLKNPITLTAKSTPSGKVTWKSSDKKIAAVDSKGRITPQKTGSVYISASCNGITKKCKVTVKKPSITASMTTLYLFEDNEFMLSASSHPNATVKWKSSNKKIVSIDKNGHV